MQRAPRPERVRGAIILFSLREKLLAYSADGAYEIVREILELRAGGYTVLGGAELLIIFPTAGVAYVFFHNI